MPQVRDVVDSDEMWMGANVGGGTKEAQWNGGEDSESATKRGASFLRWLMRRCEEAAAERVSVSCKRFWASFLRWLMRRCGEAAAERVPVCCTLSWALLPAAEA